MLLQPPCIVEEYAIGRIKPYWNQGDFLAADNFKNYKIDKQD